MTTSPFGELTTFPPFDRYSPKDFPPDKRDSPLEFTFEPDFADDGDNKNDMASDDSPFIKSEPNDFGSFDPNHFMQFPQGQQHSQFNQNAFTGNGMNVNPANLTNGNSMSQNFNQQGNMGSSFHMGNAGIADDELSDLIIPNHDQQRNNGFDFGQNMRNYAGQQQQQQQVNHSSAMFSHTPDGAPIQSPFTTDFGGYNQFRNNMSSQSQPQQSGFSGAQSLPQQAGSFRPAMQNMDRKVSSSRSPATPSMQLGDDFGHAGIQQIRHSRQSNSLGGNGWDSTPSGGHSWNDNSPFASPQNGHPMHNQITEVLRNTGGKVASSLPAKMEGGGPTFQSQEAKRRRRRESHNLVERRRRDNINERIHDLGQLVPQHRLEDEKVRKHLQTNAPLSPSITNAPGISPPSAATSLLAGPQARRATGAGSITQGLPIEDKDKGPNKGDILNGSVAWTRDLMWYMHMKLRQEQELKELVSRLGGEWPYESGEEERRMHSEICEILNKHAPAGGFTGYSRAAGSGLRVPGFTNINGDSVNGDGSAPNSTFPPQGSSVSPGFPTGGSGTGASQQAFWGGEFKEEDEYGMELQ